MFTINQDYKIIDAHTPVLTRQWDGKFEFMDCYFLEIIINSDDETMAKIKKLCAPFDYNTAVQYEISSRRFSHNVPRLFLLVGPNTIKNNFQDSDDFLALALCLDLQNTTTIEYFEVNYKFRHSYEPNQKYRRVGTVVANALQKLYQNRELYGHSALDAIKFWIKNGWSHIDEREQYLHWRHR